MDTSLLLTIIIAALFGFFALFKKLRFHQENRDEDSSSFSSSSPTSTSSLPVSSLSRTCWTHDVFPCFRGEDVRRDFLSHIQKEFRRKAITTFIDNEIERGESIDPELKKAIRESKIAVILLSRNYASSSWCLEELVEIMKCKEQLGQTVIVIFYKVDPSDLKKLTGDFGKNFKRTCKGKTKEVIERWSQALANAATVAGYHSINWDNEATMIEDIATDISNMLNNSSPSSDFDSLVGMKAHIENMEKLLCLDLDEVRMIGIWGPAGIGKSTIARSLFNKHSHQFQLSTIMVNIGKSYPRPCFDEYSAKLQLQNQFVAQIMNQKDINISHLRVAEDRLKDKKVLVVLDDVDGLGQLDALAQKTCWFGPGSRIIITTENLRVLKAHGINHIYKVDFPPCHEALQIFCWNAFGQKSPKDGFEKLAWEVTNLAGELPLGLKVMGSYFRRMSKEEWVNALPRLRTHLDGNIQSILKFSYDALDDEEKVLFLYIACFFNYHSSCRVEEYLKTNFSDVREGLNILAEKSLISLNFFGQVEMHKLLAKLGKDIVRKQSVSDPGRRQFLVDTTDIHDVLVEDAVGSRSIVGIDFNLNEINGELNISERAFERMSSLQFLRFNADRKNKKRFNVDRNMLHMGRGMNYLSRKLRLLHWDYCPMTCLSSIVNTENLVEIKMRHSKLEKLWEGTTSLKNLKWMNLASSFNLKELPLSIGNATNLRELNSAKCSSLVELPSSIGNLTSLQHLNLNGCSSLIELPSSIGNITSLQNLDLSGCSSLVELPSSIGNITSLKKLDLTKCSSLVELPSSIGYITGLKKLFLSGCSSLVELPSSIGNITSLQKLNLTECSSLVELPSSIGNITSLQNLDFSGYSSFVELSPSIENITSFQKLDLSNCSSLVELTSSIGNITSLQELDLTNCSSLVDLPPSIENISSLKNLNLRRCSSLVYLPFSIGNITSLQNLDLSRCSSLVELPSSIGNITSLQKLDLTKCSSLVELPSSIGYITGLQKLFLSGCLSLVELPSSIGNMTSLQHLNLTKCSSLVELPSSIGNIISLQNLYLCGCSSLVKLPSSIGNITSLQTFFLGGCSSLIELPSSIGNITSLQNLHLSGYSSFVELLPSIDKLFPSIVNIISIQKLGYSSCSSLVPSIENINSLQKLDFNSCSSLVELPSSIGNITSLKNLFLSGCSSLVKLPSSIGNIIGLQKLFLSDCSSLVELPFSIGNITNLKNLNIGRCSSLVKLPSSIGNISSLQYLDLNGCSSLVELPSSIGNITSMQYLNLSGCSSLVKLPSSVGNITNLQKVNLTGCLSLVEVPSSIENIISFG